MKHYPVSVVDGEFGHHARVEGADKLWKASKEGPTDAVRRCVAEHLFPLAIKDAEAQGGAVLIRMRQVAVNLWHVETDVDHRAMGEPMRIESEALGDDVKRFEVPVPEESKSARVKHTREKKFAELTKPEPARKRSTGKKK